MTQRAKVSAAFLVAVLSAAPALAQAPQSTPPTETAIVCTNAGIKYAVGEFACIAACHQQRRLARCDALTTIGSWTYVEESCPTAMINAPWPSDWTEVPAIAAMSPKPVIVNSSAIPPDASRAFTRFDGRLSLLQ